MLLNVSYKILAKIITLKLVNIPLEFVSNTQIGFIKGRYILENPLNNHLGSYELGKELKPECGYVLDWLWEIKWQSEKGFFYYDARNFWFSHGILSYGLGLVEGCLFQGGG